MHVYISVCVCVCVYVYSCIFHALYTYKYIIHTHIHVHTYTNTCWGLSVIIFNHQIDTVTAQPTKVHHAQNAQKPHTFSQNAPKIQNVYSEIPQVGERDWILSQLVKTLVKGSLEWSKRWSKCFQTIPRILKETWGLVVVFNRNSERL
jgi:hypothetical protein